MKSLSWVPHTHRNIDPDVCTTTTLCVSEGGINQDSLVTEPDRIPLIGTIFGMTEAFPSFTFPLIFMTEIKIRNSTECSHDNLYLYLNLDGRPIRQALPIKGGIQGNNDIKFIFNPPLLL